MAYSDGRREELFQKIWTAEHPDYRGVNKDGARAVVGWPAYGGGLVTAKTISDAELTARIVQLEVNGEPDNEY